MRETVRENKPIKLTKKLGDLFKKWKVQLRLDDELNDVKQVVRHATYGTETELDPVTFAVYETAIKSNYAYTFNAHCRNKSAPREIAGVVLYYDQMALRNDIDLPWFTDEQSYSAGYGKECQKDWAYCSDLIVKAGLYYDLLD